MRCPSLKLGRDQAVLTLSVQTAVGTKLVAKTACQFVTRALKREAFSRPVVAAWALAACSHDTDGKVSITHWWPNLAIESLRCSRCYGCGFDGCVYLPPSDYMSGLYA